MTDGNASEHKVSIMPHKKLLPNLSKSGYRFIEALSEFIDNSIDARTDQKTVLVQISFNAKNFEISDNASGMSEIELTNALRLGLSKKKNKLGEFGLGMKTSAVALGKKFTIKTTKKSEKYEHVFSYDDDTWMENEMWEGTIRNFPKTDVNSHGTTITITDFKFSFYGNLITNAKKQLADRYYNFLDKGELRIKVNRLDVEYKSPILYSFDGVEKFPIAISIMENKMITGWYGFKKGERVVSGEYGFNLYKNGRLIEEYAKFGFKAHPEIGKLIGDIYLDFVPVTHNKREFIASSPEYRWAVEAFANFLSKEDIRKKILIVKKLENETKEKRKVTEKIGVLEDGLNLDENAIKKVIGEAFDVSGASSLDNTSTAIDGGKIYSVTVKKKKYTFQVDMDSLGTDQPLVKAIEQKERELLILINMEFPFYSFVKDTPSYSVIIAIEALSEHITRKENFSFDHILLRNYLLREIGISHQKKEKETQIKEKLSRLQKELTTLNKEK